MFDWMQNANLFSIPFTFLSTITTSTTQDTRIGVHGRIRNQSEWMKSFMSNVTNTCKRVDWVAVHCTLVRIGQFHRISRQNTELLPYVW